MVWPPTCALVLSENGTSGLAGRRVVVTRAIGQAALLIEALEERGAIPIPLPLLEIVDAEDGGVGLANALVGLSPHDWLAVLSPNAARRVLSHSRNLEPSERPRVATIASGTQRVFREAGWTVDLVADVPSSIGLLAAFAKVEITGRVVIAQAEAGRVELREGLSARGVDVEAIAAYRNVLPALDPEMVKLATEADAVVFASPSAVERYVGHVGETPVNAVCIGVVTAETARNLAFSVTTAASPTVEAIVDALETL